MKIFLSSQNALKMANLVTVLTDLTDFGAFPGLRLTDLIFTHEIFQIEARTLSNDL